MSERLKFQGRLTEKELEAKTLRMKIEGLVKSMRDNLDPFEKPEELPLGLVSEQSFEIRNLQINLIAANDEIKAINKALGRN